MQEQLIAVERGTQLVGQTKLAADTVERRVVEGKTSGWSLARYMATSAQVISPWLSAAVGEASAMPMLAPIQKTNARLSRAYLLKEQLRQIYQLPARADERLLDRWLDWARRCRLPSFVTITTQRDGILAAAKHGLSSAQIEQLNTQIRLIARRAFGFHSPAVASNTDVGGGWM